MSDIDINRWKYYENLEKECQTLEHQVKLKSQNIQRLIQDICTLKKNIEEFRTQRSWLTDGSTNTSCSVKSGSDLCAEAERLSAKTDSVTDLIHNLELEKAELHREHQALKEMLKQEQANPNQQKTLK